MDEALERCHFGSQSGDLCEQRRVFGGHDLARSFLPQEAGSGRARFFYHLSRRWENPRRGEHVSPEPGRL